MWERSDRLFGRRLARQPQSQPLLLGEGLGLRVNVEYLLRQPAAVDDAHDPLAIDGFYADTVWLARYHIQLLLFIRRTAYLRPTIHLTRLELPKSVAYWSLVQEHRRYSIYLRRFTNKNEHGGEDMPLRPGAAKFDFDMAFGLRDDAATEFESVRAVLQIWAARQLAVGERGRIRRMAAARQPLGGDTGFGGRA
ncbi:hypothetical protein [Mesorhizobium sp. B2-6-2]|uniref:hypothetical protein n=1 Tax=Mesorhizobium sp. B2-6-2 TaxID=2589915 RepID=UPI001129299C|nr:hypothetical protein [Mesorhizobium sp. B2-6-2]TPJ74774.1 hypothetical protein FJ419_23000 [Mesorhizobium sp. B2-6-2]